LRVRAQPDDISVTINMKNGSRHRALKDGEGKGVKGSGGAKKRKFKIKWMKSERFDESSLPPINEDGEVVDHTLRKVHHDSTSGGGDVESNGRKRPAKRARKAPLPKEENLAPNRNESYGNPFNVWVGHVIDECLEELESIEESLRYKEILATGKRPPSTSGLSDPPVVMTENARIASNSIVNEVVRELSNSAAIFASYNNLDSIGPLQVVSAARHVFTKHMFEHMLTNQNIKTYIKLTTAPARKRIKSLQTADGGKTKASIAKIHTSKPQNSPLSPHIDENEDDDDEKESEDESEEPEETLADPLSVKKEREEYRKRVAKIVNDYYCDEDEEEEEEEEEEED